MYVNKERGAQYELAANHAAMQLISQTNGVGFQPTVDAFSYRSGDDEVESQTMFKEQNTGDRRC